MIRPIFMALSAAALLTTAMTAEQPQGAPASTATGNATRGEPLYLDYGCYACHGYNGQTGNGPRLLPPRLSQQQFTLYLRAPRTMQMPAYTTKVLTDEEAVDIYTYVLSLPREPQLKDVPLLNQFALVRPAEPDDPFNGTWKLNVDRSKMQEATASRSETIHYRIVGEEEHFVSEAVTAKGEPESIKYTARYNDGKGYPFSITVGGKLTTDPRATTTVRKIDTWTRERFNVRDGKPMIASRRVVSRDGRTMTLTILRLDQQGKEVVHEIRILEKQ
jgi:mono/diheme cytochrome c family protein